MFTIAIQELTAAKKFTTVNTRMETLAEAEIIARDFIEKYLELSRVELVYVEDLDYYAYVEDIRIARLTITPLYKKQETRK